MAERAFGPISLLEELRKGSGFEAALLTSFSCYLPFLEEVVLPRLRVAGCHYQVALVDRAQLARELGERSRRPRMAGRRYALLPTACGGAFHPKLVLLVGPKKARLIVGSHNLTMSGYIQNRELTNVIEVDGPKDRDGAAAVLEALEFCKAWAQPLPQALRQALEDFGKHCAQYLGPVRGPGELKVLGSRPTGPSLWRQVRRLLPEAAKRVVVVGPFFDQQLSFLRQLHQDLQPKNLLVGIDPETVSFPGQAKALPKGCGIVDVHDLNPGHKGRGFLHAKAILVETTKETWLVSGSPNPTASAWLTPAASRNAEIVVVRRVSAKEIQALRLKELGELPTLASAKLASLRARPEPGAVAGATSAPLVAVRRGRIIEVAGPFRSVGDVVVRDEHGQQLTAGGRIVGSDLFVELEDRETEASTVEATIDGIERHGFVHHPDLLRDLSISSSQRRIREALGGLSGDPSQLQELMRLIEKVIFESSAQSAPSGSQKRTKGSKSSKAADRSSVGIVETLKGHLAEERRRLGTGDLGLILDYLMKKLWRSLRHESSGSRSELELIDSDDEEVLRGLPSDNEIAEAWRRKSRTLLRRLTRRITEGTDPVPIVLESAAVLGVLEALRRIEEQDRWRAVQAEFVDRDAAVDFVFEAVPMLLLADTGILDLSTQQAGSDFAEQQALVEWLVWLAWLTGSGPSDLSFEEDPDEPDMASEAADCLARACLIAARAVATKDETLLELLRSSPFPGADEHHWLAALRALGGISTRPGRAHRPKRLPRTGDLVLLHNGAGPFVVQGVRSGKAYLIDFRREETIVPFLTNAVQVLEAPPVTSERAAS